MDSKSEEKRRRVIRKTYLSLPKFLRKYNVTTVPERLSRVCPLEDVLQSNISRPDDCQLLYTFVMGAHKASDSSFQPEYLNIQSGRPMVTSGPQSSSENDVTYLDIRENMNEGKSTTWFKYASSQIPDDVGIDLIAKVDSDCLVLPTYVLSSIDRLFEQEHVALPPQRVYGGSRQQGQDVSYMQGGFYFVSRDLADYITSDQLDRESIIEDYVKKYKFQRAEDVETSRLVSAFPGPITELEIPRGEAYIHESRMKDENTFRDRWKWYLATEVAADGIRHAQQLSNSTCPSPEQLEQEKQRFGKDLTRILSRFDLLTSQLLKKCEEEGSKK